MHCTPLPHGPPADHGWHRHQCPHCGRLYPPSPTPPIATCTASTQSPLTPDTRQLTQRLSRLAVVTCFFDPHHSEIRLSNYHRFVAGMAKHGIDVYTAEGVLPGQQRQITGDRCQAFEVRDRLWHKERLINLAIADLPPEVDAVAWMDCDLLFSGVLNCHQRYGLRAAILAALRRWPVIQPWLVVEWLREDGTPRPWNGRQRWAMSMAAKNAELPPAKRRTEPKWAHPGMAWAARRDTLEQLGGLFDAHPLGGQDSMMACAFFNQLDSPYLRQYSPAMLAAWRPWAERAAEVVAGNVGHIEAQLSHLWHGSIQSRQYRTRNRDISELGCDPRRHMITAPNGTLAWAPDTPPAIIEYCKRYFERREEANVDG